MKIINVMAASVDGRIAAEMIEGDQDRQELGLSSEEDQAFLRQQIQASDAIIVGASSIRANGECLSHPGKNGIFPTWYIMTNRDIPFDYRFWQQEHIKRVIVSRNPIPIPSHATGIVINSVYGSGDVVDHISDIVRDNRHETSLLFGGGIVNSLFYKAGKVDELRLTLSPLIIARRSAPFLVSPELDSVVSLHLNSVEHAGDYVFLSYSVKKKI